MIHLDLSPVFQGAATLGAPRTPQPQYGQSNPLLPTVSLSIGGTVVSPEEQGYSPHLQSCSLMRKSLRCQYSDPQLASVIISSWILTLWILMSLQISLKGTQVWVEKKTWPGKQLWVRNSPDPRRILWNALPAFFSHGKCILQENVYGYSIHRILFNAKFIFVTICYHVLCCIALISYICI